MYLLVNATYLIKQARVGDCLFDVVFSAEVLAQTVQHNVWSPGWRKVAERVSSLSFK